jgi:PKD repeat protein
LDLTSYGLTSGAYKLYVKAVGKPSIRNRISGAVTYSVTNAAPVASVYVTPSTGPAPLAITADTTGSTDADGSISSSTIDFGDGTTAAVSRASHTYKANGTYTVKATVKDDKGASSTATATVIAGAGATNKAPVIKLTATPTTGVGPLAVTASTTGSSDPDGTIRSTRIDFGDGFVATSASATHTYSVPGTFTVKASVTDDKGAATTTTASVKVDAGVKIMAPTATTVGTTFSLSAIGFSSKPIVATVVYLDGVQVYKSSSDRVTTNLTAKTGSRTLVVQSTNNAGTSYKSTKYLTIK